MTGTRDDHQPQARRDFATGRFRFTAWHGMALDTWLHMMKGHWRDVSPSRYPMVVTILITTTVNLIRKWLTLLLYRRKLAAVRIEPDPVFVIGHWRSGTTWLHQTLLADPAFAAPTMQACFNPEAYLTGRRVLKPILELVFPRARPMDNVVTGLEAPEEDEWGVSLSGGPSRLQHTAFPTAKFTANAAWNGEAPINEARLFREKWLAFLRGVQFTNPNKRLVLKSPGHTGRISVILKSFPNACFIHIVRDPYEVFLSSRKMREEMLAELSLQSQLPSRAQLTEGVIEKFIDLHEAYNAEKGEIPEGHLTTIRYEDLKADVSGTIRAIYDALDLGDFDEVAPLYEAKTKAVAGYKPNTFTLEPRIVDMVDQHWSDYFDCYGYAKMSERRDGAAF